MLEPSPQANPFPPGISAGDVVANRYQLEEVVGRGGMGVVVAARHLELDERVAVKFMAPDALSDPAAIARFDREVRTAARLRSEYVARVYDAGKLPDGWRYMVLEYLPGEDLSSRVQRDGPLQPSQAIRFILQACSAVLEAHELGIVHRDIKPANLRVVRQSDGSEIVKVLDFGIMKRLPGPQSDLDVHETQPGTIVGTPLYTSPEQLRGSIEVDKRTDVWSLGATLFELLSGTPPFSGTNYAQVIANVLEVPPLSLRELRPEVSEPIESVILRCLEKQPSARYSGIFEFAQALAETIEPDAEQNVLLQRMERQHGSRARHSPPSVELTARSEVHQAKGDAQPVVHRVKHAPHRALLVGRAATDGRKRLLVTGASAAVACLAVVLVGLPLVPRFGSRTASSRPIQPAPPALSLGSATTLAPRQISDQKAGNAPYNKVPEISPALVTSTRQTKRPTPNRKLYPVAPLSPAATTRTSEPNSSPSAPAPTVRTKNPLLAGPR